MARDVNHGARKREDEITRYRLAAEEALEQLEWCVDYLRRIRKGTIADAVDRNRRQIRREMTRAGT
jgi:hypothetical protein